MAIGMTWDQYWNQDCDMVRHFRKAAKIKLDLQNQQAWLQGVYFYEALIDVAPVLRAFAKKGTKPIPYRSEPLDIHGDGENKKSAERKINRHRQYMETFMVGFNQKFKKKGGGADG